MGVATRDAVRDADGPPPDDEEFAALRALLIGPEQEQLRDLRARLDDPIARARDVGRALPQALTLRAEDADLARALTPPVERAITASVRRNPHPLAEALFPVMGPAIRKAVSASLAAMIDSLNRTLEHSLSWQSLKWRLTALRTGKPFAEIVLLNTLLYRVEQIFLIDRRTGLLLQHVRAGSGAFQDADMVSGMLTAIRDFVQDSFSVSTAESLDALRVGDLSIWIEQGPRAIIAAVIRGRAPQGLRGTLQQALETVHLQQADALEHFDGDASAFEAARPTLESCLQAEYRADRRRPGKALWFVLAACLILVALWTALWLRDRARWGAYLDALRAEPGIVVVSTGSAGGKYVVQGLRDPLARDPVTVLAESRLTPAEVASRWEPFQALDQRFVLQRAATLLHPPSDVTLTLKDGVLRAEGRAPAEWAMEARRAAPFIAGISGFDGSGLTAVGLHAAEERLEAIVLLFAKGTARLLPGQDDRLLELSAALTELDDLARSEGRRIVVHVVGHTDADGDEVANMPLSRTRAQRVVERLSAAPLTHVDLVPEGVGSHQPAVPGQTEEQMQQNRRVVLRADRPVSGAEGGVRR